MLKFIEAPEALEISIENNKTLEPYFEKLLSSIKYASEQGRFSADTYPVLPKSVPNYKERNKERVRISKDYFSSLGYTVKVTKSTKYYRIEVSW